MPTIHYFINDWGDTADSIPAILAANLAHMDEKDYINYLSYQITKEEILEWCLKQPQFFEHFSNAIRKAENDYCESMGYYVEEEEEDE